MNIRKFLEDRHVVFEVHQHPDTRTARELALAVDVPDREVAKTVMLRLNGGYRYAVAVLPASHVIDFAKLAVALGGSEAVLATEQELAERCPDCERGVVPPFGSRYGMLTLVDQALSEDEEIVFEGNTHHEAIRLHYRDFYDLERPLVATFARPRNASEGAR